MWTELPDDVKEELENGLYKTRSHGRRATHSAGCRGPLCMQAFRNDQRARYAERRRRQGKTYHPDERVRVNDPREAELHKIMVWHWTEKFNERMGISVG